MHLLWGRVHCWQIVFWNSWVSLTLNLRHHFLHCLVSGVYQPECVIHYVINDTTVLIYYEILLRLQTGEAITVSVMMGPQVIGVFVDDYQLFCYDAPPTPFEEPEGRAYCFAGVSVCQSIISSRSFSSQRQCTYQKSNLVYRFIIY